MPLGTAVHANRIQGHVGSDSLSEDLDNIILLSKLVLWDAAEKSVATGIELSFSPLFDNMR